MQRRTNLATGLLLILAAGTGVGANLVGRDWPLDLIQLHLVAAVGVLLLAPWKGLVIRQGLARRRSRPDGGPRRDAGKVASVSLLVVVLLAVGTGLAHATGLVEYLPAPAGLPALTVMQVHVGAAVLAVLLVALHWRRHPVRPRPVDVRRRALLSAGALLGAASVVAVGWESAVAAGGLPGGRRRFTGSVPTRDLDVAALPVYAWIEDSAPPTDVATWRLRLPGGSMSLPELEALATDEVEAVLDCTGGWSSRQRWRGVRLDRLVGPLPAGTRSLAVTSRTGYVRHLPIDELDRLWLATQVGGAPLSPGHGFPVRLVVPGRRGFWWVKWVDELAPSELPYWLQVPFPTS